VSRPVSPDDISPISIAAEGFRGIDGRSAAGGNVAGDSRNKQAWTRRRGSARAGQCGIAHMENERWLSRWNN